MIRNPHLLENLDRTLLRNGRDHLSPAKSFRIFEELWREAMSLGVLPLDDPLDGIETDIRLARILNSCSKNSSAD